MRKFDAEGRPVYCEGSGTPVPGAAEGDRVVKQLGARPVDLHATCADTHEPAECWPFGTRAEGQRIILRDRKGGDPAEWPKDLRVREWPGVAS